MRPGLIISVAAVVAAALLPETAGADHAAAARLRHSVRLSVALPRSGGTGIAVLKVKTVGRHRRAAIRVRGLNQSRLPCGIRAIAIVTPGVSHSQTATFTIYVAITNLRPCPASDAHVTTLPNLEISVTDPFGFEEKVLFTEDLKFPDDCRRLNYLGAAADGQGYPIDLYKLAPGNSDPEEILDHIALDRLKCPGAESPVEPGPT